MLVLFTDLDGTLLDQPTCSPEPAREALRRIQAEKIPLVFCTSKTRAEVEYWRARLGNRHPFIVENGGALYVPEAYFSNKLSSSAHRDGYAVVEFGVPYDHLVNTLRQVSQETRCHVLGFSDMSAEEVNSRYGLPIEQSRLAKIREYDEPFEILDREGNGLLAAIERSGKYWTRGGRLHHITGHKSKAGGVRLLADRYREEFGSITAVGLGDGMNDLDFLSCVDAPVVIRSEAAWKLAAALPRARVTALPGAAGWNQAVLEILEE
jgi:mannosyl-3-phosphoglycerate phosphatase